MPLANSFANAFANTSPRGRLDRVREDVSGSGFRAADHVRVHAKGDRRISVAEPGSDDVDRHPCKQQGGGVKVAKIMKASVRKWSFGYALVADFDDLPHERGHRV